MEPLRFVPWVDSKEWNTIFKSIYSTDDKQRLLAIQRISAWQSKGKVPHAVNSTALFTDIQLTDSRGIHSEKELKLLYSMAFVRFVNGFVDSMQKGTFASSVAIIAHQLGLPNWFVELRHSATHDHLPSLDLLRSGACQALEWLNTHYWSCQTIIDTSYQTSTAMNEYFGNFFLSSNDLNKDAKTFLLLVNLTETTKDYFLGEVVDWTFRLDEFSISSWRTAWDVLDAEWPGIQLDYAMHFFEKLLCNIQTHIPMLHDREFSDWLLFLAQRSDCLKKSVVKLFLANPNLITPFIQDDIPISFQRLMDFKNQKLEVNSTRDTFLKDEAKELMERIEHISGTRKDINNLKKEKRWDILTSWHSCPIGTIDGRIPLLELPSEFECDAYLREKRIIAETKNVGETQRFENFELNIL